jgi:hypothetical protein
VVVVILTKKLLAAMMAMMISDVGIYYYRYQYIVPVLIDKIDVRVIMCMM